MRQAFLFFSVFFICTTASADMVEIKGEGFFNGTIESEESDKVTFRDAAGKVRTLAKKDILFMERQTQAPPAQKALQKIAPVKSTKKSPSAQTKKKESSSGSGDATGALRAIGKARVSVRESNARVEQALREGDAGAEEKKDSKEGRFGSL